MDVGQTLHMREATAVSSALGSTNRGDGAAVGFFQRWSGLTVRFICFTQGGLRRIGRRRNRRIMNLIFRGPNHSRTLVY